ncbi:MAG TPA: HAMP domain-containing sensor histidine kinase [Candidatus Dormibacteraeota bacterium]|jgi:signal transduction histidine kinase|nr:HAMP domain-containing sensor histidine kinase [Candidatus Dormibacteraeota bacterium]
MRVAPHRPPFRPLARLATRVSLATLAVAFLAIGVLAVGVLIIARSSFDGLMVKSGVTATEAQAMFDHGVAEIFAIAMGVALLVSAVLSVVVAVRLAHPLNDMSQAARRIAGGDYRARVPRAGPAEVTSLSDSFNQMAVSLDDQERVRRDFIVNAAHELRTPLTNLQGYLEALRDGVIAPTREQFTSLNEEVERLARLAQSLDSLAEHNGEHDRPAAVDVDLAQSLRTAAELARPAFDAKAISFETSIADGLRARGDADRLAQVLSNLLQNAARYTPRAGHVCLSAEPRDDEALVIVTNSGEGIPPGDLPRVFERFYRVDKSRASARGGAGIGLAIVKQLVEADDGEVGADSQPGATRFWFRLPA